MYQRQIISREQLLNEMLRVKLTAEKMQGQLNIGNDKEKLFQFMKRVTEDELGFFPADRDDFIDFFEVLKDIDPIEYKPYSCGKAYKEFEDTKCAWIKIMRFLKNQ